MDETDGAHAQPSIPSPPCYNCQRPTTHCVCIADFESGKRFDIFQCSFCQAITWSPPLSKLSES